MTDISHKHFCHIDHWEGIIFCLFPYPSYLEPLKFFPSLFSCSLTSQSLKIKISQPKNCASTHWRLTTQKSSLETWVRLTNQALLTSSLKGPAWRTKPLSFPGSSVLQRLAWDSHTGKSGEIFTCQAIQYSFLFSKFASPNNSC